MSDWTIVERDLAILRARQSPGNAHETGRAPLVIGLYGIVTAGPLPPCAASWVTITVAIGRWLTALLCATRIEGTVCCSGRGRVAGARAGVRPRCTHPVDRHGPACAVRARAVAFSVAIAFATNLGTEIADHAVAGRAASTKLWNVSSGATCGLPFRPRDVALLSVLATALRRRVTAAVISAGWWTAAGCDQVVDRRQLAHTQLFRVARPYARCLITLVEAARLLVTQLI